MNIGDTVQVKNNGIWHNSIGVIVEVDASQIYPLVIEFEGRQLSCKKSELIVTT